MNCPIKFRVWDTKLKIIFSWNPFIRFDDPEYVIMQYTGLKDKHGTDIYVGDIVQLSGRDVFLPERERYVVQWNARRAGFEFQGLHPSRGTFTHIDNYYNGYTIIGNIYVNPELVDDKILK